MHFYIIEGAHSTCVYNILESRLIQIDNSKLVCHKTVTNTLSIFHCAIRFCILLPLLPCCYCCYSYIYLYIYIYYTYVNWNIFIRYNINISILLSLGAKLSNPNFLLQITGPTTKCPFDISMVIVSYSANVICNNNSEKTSL